MKSAHQIALNQRLRTETSWRLLAADSAPVILGLLQIHLLDKERRLPSSLLHERIARDLETLRSQGHDLSQNAQYYLAQWLSAGFLERRLDPGESEEVYELTAAAVQAIRFIQGLSERRTAATESRLSLVIGELSRLAEQTDADPQSRIEYLEREQRRISEEIAAIRDGRLETLAEDRALERTREIIALADELANDFRHVREEFQQLNRSLRESLMEGEGSRGEVLDAVFAGVDLIAESDAGRTFKAFWRLLTDPRQGMELEEALTAVLSRGFATKLKREERRFLLEMTKLLLARGGDVHEVLQLFARGLKQFVQSREFREQRRLSRLLREAQREALAIKDAVSPIAEIGHTLDLTSCALRSLAQQQLRDPTLDAAEGGIERAAEAEISLTALADLVALSEIDFRRLKGHVQTLLAELPQVSVAQILERFPAEQGLGSVVGYLALGARHGVLSQQSEQVTWEGRDGAVRGARIPCIWFVKERAHELE